MQVDAACSDIHPNTWTGVDQAMGTLRVRLLLCNSQLWEQLVCDQLKDQSFHVAWNSLCILVCVSPATVIAVVSDRLPGEPSKAVLMYGQIADWRYAVK